MKIFATIPEALTMNNLTAAVDAAMVEMANIYPPLRRSDCDRLILAALKSGKGEAVAWVVIAPDGSWSEPQATEKDATDLAGDMDKELPPQHEGPAHLVVPLYTAPPATADAVSAPRELLELEWLEHWLLFASEPVGQECCNRPGSECCGCPDTCYRTADDIATEMHARHEELRALLAQSKGVK